LTRRTAAIGSRLQPISTHRSANAWFLFLSERTADDSAVDSARRHLAIIANFRRFPHRNAILGRRSTAAELAFLKRPGSSF